MMTEAGPALGIGDAFPEFSLERPEGGFVSKADLAGRKAVLFFYPKDDTPGCTTEALEFSAALPRFADAGIAVLGISKDPPAKHRRFIAKHGLTVDLASDVDDGVSDTLGIWTEKRNYSRTYMGMVRTTYLLDEGGIILRVWPKVRVKGHVVEVLTAASAA